MDPTRRRIRSILAEAEEAQTIQGYEDAGTDAQPEVQEALKRYAAMSPEERGDTPLLYWLLGSGTPPYKMSKEESEYVDDSETEGQTCENCAFGYVRTATGQLICSQIRGIIKPEGWCNLWKPADEVDPVDEETGE